MGLCLVLLRLVMQHSVDTTRRSVLFLKQNGGRVDLEEMGEGLVGMDGGKKGKL